MQVQYSGPFRHAISINILDITNFDTFIIIILLVY